MILTISDLLAALRPIGRGVIEEAGLNMIRVSVPAWSVRRAAQILDGQLPIAVRADVVSLGFIEHFTQWRWKWKEGGNA